MKLIIGLGNYPKKYEKTRHNFGFLLVNFLKDKYSFTNFKFEKKFFGELSTGEIASEKIILLKPHTLMNLSGQSVSAVSNFYKIPVKDIIVFSDDADLKFGDIRFRHKGSAGGHNGLKSIINSLGSKDFPRLKLGISSEDRNRLPLHVFALQNFNDQEMKTIPQILKKSLVLFFDNIK